MVVCSVYQWKQVLEGMRRGDVPPHTQTCFADGDDGVRECYINGVVKLRMTVYGAQVLLSYLCIRKFEIIQSYIDTCSYIYIPSTQDIEDWNDLGLDVESEIAAREV